MGNGRSPLTKMTPWVLLLLLLGLSFTSPLLSLQDENREEVMEEYRPSQKLLETLDRHPQSLYRLLAIPQKQMTPMQKKFDPNWFRKRNGGGSCMFNSLAYNCDFQDAIGAAHEAAYWGSSSPGKRSGGSKFPKSSLKTFPKNSQRDLAGYQRRSPDGGVAHKHHLPSIA